MTHLIDTSVLTRLSTPQVRSTIEPLVGSGRAARSSMSDLEIGYSARNRREWEGLMTALGVFEPIEVEPAHFARALQVQRLLATKSQRGRKVPDLLIAAVAEARRLTVVHYDHDFDVIAQVTGQPCEWVVPRGTID